MPLSNSGVVQRFASRRRGKSAHMVSDGESLRDYGWYFLAYWSPEGIVVNRHPYNSCTSKRHHTVMVRELGEAGYSPAKFLDDQYSEVLWTRTGTLKEATKRAVYNSLTFSYKIHPLSSQYDSVVVKGCEVPWRTGERLRGILQEYFFGKGEPEALEKAYRLCMRSRASRKAARTLRDKLHPLRQKIVKLHRVVHKLPLGNYKTFSIEGHEPWYEAVRLRIGNIEYSIRQDGKVSCWPYQPGEDLPTMQYKIARFLVPQLTETLSDPALKPLMVHNAIAHL